MKNNPADRAFQDLSTPEKVLHVQDLWDQIACSQEEVVLPPAQLAEAERRIEEHERNSKPTTSRDDLRRKLEQPR